MLVLAELGDPPGLSAALSNVDRDTGRSALREQVGQGWHADAADAIRDAWAEQPGGVACEDHGNLHAGGGGAIGRDVEGNAGPGWVRRAGAADDDQFCHACMMKAMPAVEVVDSVRTPIPPPPERLRDGYFEWTQRLLAGLVRWTGDTFSLGPLKLIEFGPPARTESGWSCPLRGGLLAAEPGGSLDLEFHNGVTTAAVHGYRPSLPRPLYRLTQLPFHHLQSRLALLRMRGRLPAPAPPATPAARLAAGAIDALLCLGLARGRPFRAVVIGAVYHVAGWSFAGLTLGGLILGQRVVAIDGSPVTPGQALVRLALLPASLLRLRAFHDEVAGTEVVRP